MKKLFMIMMTLMCVSWGLSAQNRTISGTVVDAGNNEPLIGATVMPVGGGQGASTDVDGNFTVSVPANVKMAKISYVGYKEQTVALTPGMKVRLESSSTNLQDVVVVAYGTANKESLTGSVAVVGAGEIEDRPVSSVTAALEGNAPGVQVNNSVSYPGASPDIRIRGFNSFTKYNSPLYVVDGVVYDGGIADINPADVESMSVLKDAASCALYGNRGANGVVLITTKRAKNVGKVDVNLSINQGFYNKALPFYDRLGTDQWMETAYNAYAMSQVTNGTNPDLAAALADNNNKTNFINGILNGTNIYGVDATELFDGNGRLTRSYLPGYTDLDWWDAISQTGYRQEYNVNASGATEKFNVFSSFGYMKENGYIIKTDFERFNGRLVANYNPVSYFKTGINLSATYSNTNVAGVSASDYSKSEEGQSSGLSSVTNPFLTINNAPVQPYYNHDENGNIVYGENGEESWNTGGLNNGDNVAWTMRLNEQESTSLAVNGNVYATGVLPYGFEVSLRASMWRSKDNGREYSNNIIGSQKGTGGLDVNSVTYRSHTFMQQISWNHDYGLNNIDVFLDHENYESSYDYRSIRLAGQQMDDMPYMGNFEESNSQNQSLWKLRTESYLGRVKYNYDQKYFGEASIRRDGTSRFAKDNRWGTFWSVGASWILSKEKFLQDAKWVNFLKLRAAYGSVGNDAAADAYATYALYYQHTYDNVGILLPAQIPGDNLRWEATKTLDVALEGSLFNDRFTFSIGYYNKRNTDLLYEVKAPISAGTVAFPSQQGKNLEILTNVGTMLNWGWELQFGVDIIRNQNVKWDFNLDASFLKNRIVKLPNGQDIAGSALFQGKSIYEKYTYTWAGVDNATGNSLYNMEPYSPKYYKYKENGEKYYDEAAFKSNLEAARSAGCLYEIDGQYYTSDTQYAAQAIQGTALPTVYGSFSTNVEWKGIKFGALFTYSLGGKTYNGLYQGLVSQSANAGAIHKDVLNAWTQPILNANGEAEHFIRTDVLPVQDYERNRLNNANSSRFLFDASYLTLKNINLSYDFPKKWVNALKLQNINIGVSIDNLFIVTAKKGMNPQYSFKGRQEAYFMPARTFNFSLGFKF